MNVKNQFVIDEVGRLIRSIAAHVSIKGVALEAGIKIVTSVCVARGAVTVHQRKRM